MHNASSLQRRQQSGATLVVSLLIMVILTLIGISSMSNSRLEQRMSHNYRLADQAFQARETAIHEIMSIGNPNLDSYDSEADLLEDAMGAGLNTPMNHSLTLNGGETTVNSTVTYTSTADCDESSYELFICHRFEVRSTATIGNTGTGGSNRQGLSRLGPGGE